MPRIAQRITTTLPEAPGLYEAHGSDPAYFLLLGAVASGNGKLIGERYLPPNDAVLVAETFGQSERALLAHERSRKFASNPQEFSHKIRIGHNFYLAALKDYFSWEEKWWREAVQNSVDAGAKNISLSVQRQEDGSVLVTCEDDGRGMTEEILIDKFLVLGGTTKTSDSGGVGGFGKAKELLLLPWLRWSVWVNGKRASGEGDSYNIEDAPARTGVKLEVLMPKDKHTSIWQAKSFLQKCDLSRLNVTLDGAPFTDWLKIQKKIRELPGKAEVYVKETVGLSRSQMMIRVRGIFMFNRYLDSAAEAIVVVEITAPSTDVLTANRDGFRDYDLQNAIDELTNEVSKNVMSALREKKGLFRKVYKGSGKFKAKVTDDEDMRSEEQAEILSRVGSKLAGKDEADEEAMKALEFIADLNRAAIERMAENERLGGVAPQNFLPTGKTAREMISAIGFSGPEHQATVLLQMVWKPDFYLINDIEGYKPPKIFMPEKMSATVLRLLRVWTELCRFVLMQLKIKETFGVGFYFSPRTRAACLKEEDEQWLVLNPYKDLDTRKTLYRPTDDSDLSMLYALAIHEVSHIEVGGHDEQFAAVMTDNVAKCALGWRAIKRIAGSIKLSGEKSPEAD